MKLIYVAECSWKTVQNLLNVLAVIWIKKDASIILCPSAKTHSIISYIVMVSISGINWHKHDSLISWVAKFISSRSWYALHNNVWWYSLINALAVEKTCSLLGLKAPWQKLQDEIWWFCWWTQKRCKTFLSAVHLPKSRTGSSVYRRIVIWRLREQDK